MTAVAQILSSIEQGDQKAAGELLPMVYAELRKLAAAYMANEGAGHTLSATALVHEADLRLVGDQKFANRGHFFAAAAEAMRRVLVENARSKGRLKRGKDRVRLELLDQARSLPEDPDLLLSLDELLTRLATEDAISARVAHLHLFGGLSVEDAGEVLGLSRPVAYRNWKYARVWLREALGK
jgi:RNA polymerase sigma factor (TIGR02999 family)